MDTEEADGAPVPNMVSVSLSLSFSSLPSSLPTTLPPSLPLLLSLSSICTGFAETPGNSHVYCFVNVLMMLSDVRAVSSASVWEFLQEQMTASPSSDWEPLKPRAE